MRLIARRVGWNEKEWADAGYNDAMTCIAPRYDGDDWTDDMCQQYIIGYQHGRQVSTVTAPCDRLRKARRFEWPEQSTLEPGLFSENWRGYFEENGWIIASFFSLLIGFAIFMWWLWEVLP